jgi:Flp pilus assembly protein TadG
MQTAKLISRLGHALRSFCSAREGNVAIGVGLVSIALFGFVGAAIDYSRANLLKTSMQSALDSTTLKLGRQYYTLSGSLLQTEGSDIFASLFKRPEAKNTAVTVAIDPTASTIQADSSASLDTTFLSVIGIDSIQIKAHSTVNYAVQTALRVALVLDNTGSMGQAGKMTALQTAAKNMITKLQTSSTSAGDIYVSIVPFAKDVNLGTGNAGQPWILWDDGTDNSWDGAKGSCSNSAYTTRSQCQAQGTCSISGYTTQQTCTAAATGSCSISGYTTQNSCTSAGVCSRRRYTSQWNCTSHRGTWTWGQWTVGPGGTWTSAAWTPTSHSSWTGCVVDRGDFDGPDVGDYDTNAVLPTTSIEATLYVPEQYSACPQAAMGPSANWSGMKTLIDNMSPGGNTNQAIGLQLGWMSLMEGGVFNAPAKTSGVTYADHIVLLTDGLNTEDRWYGDQASIDARQQLLCDNIKAAKITLWTIQVNTGTDPTSTLLQNCASDPSKFYLLTSASQIISTFDDISFKIVQLHLSK